MNAFVYTILKTLCVLYAKKGLSSHGLPKRSPTLVLTVPEAAQLRSSDGIRCFQLSLDDSKVNTLFWIKYCFAHLFIVFTYQDDQLNTQNKQIQSSKIKTIMGFQKVSNPPYRRILPHSLIYYVFQSHISQKLRKIIFTILIKLLNLQYLCPKIRINPEFKISCLKHSNSWPKITLQTLQFQKILFFLLMIPYISKYSWILLYLRLGVLLELSEQFTLFNKSFQVKWMTTFGDQILQLIKLLFSQVLWNVYSKSWNLTYQTTIIIIQILFNQKTDALLITILLQPQLKLLTTQPILLQGLFIPFLDLFFNLPGGLRTINVPIYHLFVYGCSFHLMLIIKSNSCNVLIDAIFLFSQYFQEALELFFGEWLGIEMLFVLQVEEGDLMMRWVHPMANAPPAISKTFLISIFYISNQTNTQTFNQD